MSIHDEMTGKQFKEWIDAHREELLNIDESGVATLYDWVDSYCSVVLCIANGMRRIDAANATDDEKIVFD